jgi:tetratricopeptide (TPR) repeat protein
MAENQRIDDLRRRIQKDPASIAFAQLAEELRRAGQCQEAVDTCRAGLSIHPGYLSARVTLGRALFELNQLDEALAELQLVLRSAPENLAAIRGIAEIHHRQGQLGEALHQYRTALTLARNDPDLERTVKELSREIEPQKPAVPTDGLSFEQMQQELLKHSPPPPLAAAAEQAAPPPPSAATTQQVAPPPAPESSPATPAQASAPLPVAPGVAAPPATTEIERESPAEAPVEQAASAASPEPEATQADAAPEVQSVENPTRERALHTVAALEQWLDAIHVARTDERP